MSTKQGGDPFSEVASEYDRSFSDKPYVRALRARVQRTMSERFAHSGTILELGCGTGIDAVFLAAQGYRIIATDPSKGMIQMATRRAAAAGKEICFMQLRAEELSCIRSNSVDGILSNFGALNCVSNLETVLHESNRILRDNGVFILTLINKFSAVETLAYLRHGHIRQAFRRWTRGGVSVPVGSGSVLTYYHSLSSLKKMIQGTFTIREVVGLNILTPTPSFESAWQRHPRLTAFASAVERAIDSLPVVSTLGDHFVVVLEKFE